jgi:hypothetical protein
MPLLSVNRVEPGADASDVNLEDGDIQKGDSPM